MQTIRKNVLPTKKYDSNSFMNHPSGDKLLPQLWEPFAVENLLGDGDEQLNCCKIRKTKIVAALKRYYTRIFGFCDVNTFAEEITVAGNAWKDSIVISSVYGREKKALKTRANNIVLFEAELAR